jgi:hypothetical protein
MMSRYVVTCLSGLLLLSACGDDGQETCDAEVPGGPPFSFVPDVWTVYSVDEDNPDLTYMSTKNDFLFDEEGRIEQMIDYNVEAYPNQRYVYSYDGEGRISRIERDDYDTTFESWISEARYDYEYTDTGLLDRIVTETPDGVYTWGVSSQEIYEYDSDGRLSRILNTAGELDSNVNSRSSYTYDSAGRVTDHLYEHRELGEWVPFSRELFKYNDSGQLKSKGHESFEDDEWEPSFKTEYQRDACGRVGKAIGETYEDGAWSKTSRSKYWYNESSQLYVIERHEKVEGEWLLATRIDIVPTDEGDSSTFEMEDPRPLREWINRYYGFGNENKYAE